MASDRLISNEIERSPGCASHSTSQNQKTLLFDTHNSKRSPLHYIAQGDRLMVPENSKDRLISTEIKRSPLRYIAQGDRLKWWIFALCRNFKGFNI